jgi:hypothetical protein
LVIFKTLPGAKPGKVFLYLSPKTGHIDNEIKAAWLRNKMRGGVKNAKRRTFKPLVPGDYLLPG